MVDLVKEIPTDQLIPREGVRTLGGSHELVVDSGHPRVAIIRTSDRVAFKACRRRWGWSSHLRHNLGPRYGIAPLWLGTGLHFALEDFHGYNRFGHPKTAFEAFVKASTLHNKKKLPEDLDDLVALGSGMMDYYILWLQQRPHSLMKTLWVNGIPQVEVNFRFRIPGDWTRFGYDEVYYSGTIDRVCVDQDGVLWPLDYKSAKNIEIMHYLTDPQVGAYMWATPHLYDMPVGGFMYMQFRKAIPNPGRILMSGGVSHAQGQSTTHFLYRKTLQEVYGSVDNAPEKCQGLLNELAIQEDENKDSFIQIDRIYRNERQAQSEGVKILMEIEDMLNPNLPLYPNPTRFCAAYNNPCPFLSPCTSMDDGGDWLYELEATTEPRESKYDAWRNKLVYPGDEKPDTNFGDRSWLESAV
jgi:hypothetical protein